MPDPVFAPVLHRPGSPAGDEFPPSTEATSRTAPRRRGRPPAASAAGVATEIRRRRDALGLTLREAAALTGVSPTVICEVERGRRTPSLRTYGKLRDGLGLTAPMAELVGRRVPSVPLDDQYRATLAACVITAGGAGLADLAAALGVSIPAVREGLSVLTDRLAQVGLAVVDDGVAARVVPLPFAHDAVAAVTPVEAAPAITDEQLTILCSVAFAGAATRRRLEQLRGKECESLLRRMVDAGLLDCARDDGTPQAPNLYRVTATALATLGYPTLEAFKDAVASRLDPAELLKAQELDAATDPVRD